MHQWPGLLHLQFAQLHCPSASAHLSHQQVVLVPELKMLVNPPKREQVVKHNPQPVLAGGVRPGSHATGLKPDKQRSTAGCSQQRMSLTHVCVCVWLE